MDMWRGRETEMERQQSYVKRNVNAADLALDDTPALITVDGAERLKQQEAEQDV